MRPNKISSWLWAAVVLGSMAWADGMLGTASAQRSSYDRRDRQEHVAGRFDYFQLVLSWSPTHCEDNSRGSNDTQCGFRRARPYAFVLHGLWPQYERGYPQSCRIEHRPFVPNNVIDGMMDIMPSRGLIIHQYKKHGTCSGLRPDDYFRVSRALFKRIKIPARYQNPTQALFSTPDGLAHELVQANPGLKPDMLKIVCKRGSGNSLKEIRICLTRKGEFRACSGRGGHQCAPAKMYIPPAR
ncbi:MAG TPA: ribonuclease T [Hyphomicrobiaceae bacterium]|nr:ribonuclease T [Hyphomicrobiaceae bacterium]